MALTEAQIRAYLRPKVERDIMRRGTSVKLRAQDNLRGYGGAPRRVYTARLLSSITVRLIRGGVGVRNPRVRIGTIVRYSKWVHDGTGIYGPRKQRIRPRRAKALRFRTRSGQVVFAKSVRGMKPNRFLTDALIAARDRY